MVLERETRGRVGMKNFVSGSFINSNICHCVRNGETRPTVVSKRDDAIEDSWAVVTPSD